MIFDAVIVGAGPAGATTALLLAQAGWKVALVEKQDFPRGKVCGEFISATSLPLLQKLGVADFYLKQGGPSVKQVGFFAGAHALVSAMPPALDSVCQWGRAVGRDHLDNALLAQAVNAGVTVWQPWAVNAMQRLESEFVVTVRAANEIQSISARLMVMAHGSWERGVESVRDYPHLPSDLLAFKAHFNNSALAEGLMPMLAFPGGYGGMVRTDSDLVTLSCCIRRDMLALARKRYSGLSAGGAVLEHISVNCLGVQQALIGATRVGKWLSAGPIRPGLRHCYKDGVFFVGNIAGEAHPIVAEGISMAMQSGWLLAETLITHANHNRELVGKIYAKQWRKHFVPRIRAAAMFSRLAMRPWAIRLMGWVLKHFPRVLTWGAKLSGKITQVVPVTNSVLDKVPIATEMGSAT